MTPRATLADLATVLLDDATSPTLLADTLDRYRDLLLTASGLDMSAPDSLQPHDTGRGVAIGATWAALCLDDQLRTWCFIRGLAAAVAERRANGPVHVLYAGTGPFATLALPLMTRYRPDELQFTFLEINAVSLAAVRHTLRALGLEDYVRDVVQTDASTYQVPDPEGVDILLTETMQYGLVDEMQVPIALNLLNQLPGDALMVPERIELSLVLLRDDRKLAPVTGELGSLITVDRQSLRAYLRTEASTDFPTVRIALPESGGWLAMRTAITTYGPHRLADYDSGLTFPDLIGQFPDELGVPDYVDCTYQMDPSPFMRMAFAAPALAV